MRFRLLPTLGIGLALSVLVAVEPASAQCPYCLGRYTCDSDCDLVGSTSCELKPRSPCRTDNGICVCIFVREMQETSEIFVTDDGIELKAFPLTKALYQVANCTEWGLPVIRRQRDGQWTMTIHAKHGTVERSVSLADQ